MSNTPPELRDLFSNTGQHEKAIAESRRARELETLRLSTNAIEAQFLFYARRGDEAIERVNQTLDLGLLERSEKMAEYPLGHMSSLFARVHIGETEMDSLKNS